MHVMELSPEVARARELDAEGRHDEAVDQLAAGARRGDIEATTQLAKRLIVGDRAPRLWRQGVGLLQDAARGGGGEAADRLAVIVASGAFGPPDWQTALRLLVVAAERGWLPALAQLEALAATCRGDSSRTDLDPSPQADPLPPSRASSAEIDPSTVMSETGPSELTAQIGASKLLAPDRGFVVHDDPRICRFPALLGKPACDWLIERARVRLERALVYDVFKQTDVVDESRSNSAAVFNRMEGDLVHLMVQARISAACGQPVTHMEAPTVLHYAVGEEIRNHYDFVDPAQPGYDEEIRRFGYRVLTFLVYLNHGYDGGETVFPKLDLAHAGAQGEGLSFANTLRDGQADIRTLHAGRPPTRGEKWVFSQFVRNRPEPIPE